MWLILAAITAFVYVIGFIPLKYWEKKRLKLTIRPWPFFGHFGAFALRIKSMGVVLDHIYKSSNKRYIPYYNMTSPVLMIKDVELAKNILIKEFDTFPHHKPFTSEDVDPYWSKNLFAMMGGPKWQEMRSTLSPSFTSSKMRMMFVLMRECSQQFVNYYSKQGSLMELDVKESFGRFAADVIATTAFGISVDSLENKSNEFYLTAKETAAFTFRKGLVLALQHMSPFISKILKLKWFTPETTKFFRSIIDETVKAREEKGIVRPDMIHLLLQARNGQTKQGSGATNSKGIPELDNLNITAQALIFFCAGFDSVSTLMTYTAYELALHPEVQKKLREEVDGSLKGCNGEFNYEAVMGMKYLDMVIQEAGRKWPSFFGTDRLSVKSYTIEPEEPGEQPLHLEAGSSIWIPIYSIQRDPKYFPDPDKFDPERFSDENKHKINNLATLSFGSGPRNCIGARYALMESKLIIAEIISKFEIVPVKKTPKEIIFKAGLFSPFPSKGLWLGLKPRY